MCEKKDKTRQSDAKICLMIVVKIKERHSKLHVEQLPSKNPEKIFRSHAGGIPAHDLRDSTANTPPILRLDN